MRNIKSFKNIYLKAVIALHINKHPFSAFRWYSLAPKLQFTRPPLYFLCNRQRIVNMIFQGCKSRGMAAEIDRDSRWLGIPGDGKMILGIAAHGTDIAKFRIPVPDPDKNPLPVDYWWQVHAKTYSILIMFIDKVLSKQKWHHIKFLLFSRNKKRTDFMI